MQDAVIAARFNANQRESVKHWLNQRHAQVWGFADWPWKTVSLVTLDVTSGDNTPTLASDVDFPTAVYDDLGTRLLAMQETDFDDYFIYSQINSSTGRPSAYKWSNGVLTLGPTPGSNYTYRYSYQRKLGVLVGGANYSARVLTDDTDTPMWDAQHHYLLTQGAIATGLKIENDPTWKPLEEDFLMQLDSMREEYLPSVLVTGGLQYGRDDLGLYEG